VKRGVSILPSEEVSFSQSLLGYGSYLLRKIGADKSVDELYEISQLWTTRTGDIPLRRASTTSY